MRFVRIVSAKMEEPQRPSVDFIVAPGPNDFAAVEVPVGDVTGRITQDVVRIHAGDEINPTLIGESHSRRVDNALAPEPHPPPIKEALAARADGDKSEIVDSRAKNVRFG